MSFLRVPHVALRAEELDARAAAVDHGILPFDDFVGRRHGHDEKQREKHGHAQAGEPAAGQPFGHREGVKADDVVADAVEMVAPLAQQRGEQAVRPIERHFGEGVMRADAVHRQPQAHQEIGGVAETEAAGGGG